MENEEVKVEETPVESPTEESTEDLEKRLAEAKARRDELLKSKIAKLEAETKELEEDKELSQYVFPETNKKPTIVQAEPTGNYIDNLKKLFDSQVELLHLYPNDADKDKRKVLPRDMVLPNGISVHQAFYRYYFRKEPLEKILE